jgi:cytochrome c peroxidase
LSKLATALAAFVSRIHSEESVVDRFQSGVVDALDDRERAGLWLYESKAGCWHCHTGSNYTDEEFHATGVGARDGKLARGRAEFTEDESDVGKFKTPTLRGVAFTAPYMHDGSSATLEESWRTTAAARTASRPRRAHPTPRHLRRRSRGARRVSCARLSRPAVD